MSDFFNWQSAGAQRASSMNTLSPHLAGLMSWLLQNYGGSNLGGHVDRPVRGGTAPSSHAFGAATDWGYQDRGRADQVINQILSNPAAYGIQAIHDYDRMRVWHAGRGWKAQSRGSHGGLMKPGTHHLHFEVNEANYSKPFDPSGASSGAIGRAGPLGDTIGGLGSSSGGAATVSAPSWAPATGSTAMDNSEGIFKAWLRTQSPETQQDVITRIQQGSDLAGVAALQDQYGQGVVEYMGYLSKLSPEAQQASISGLSAEAAPSAAPESTPSPELTSLLQKFGVSYPNAPQPTPALMAFLNGLGLNLQTAADLKNRALERIGAATSDAMADIDRTAGRTKQNITADLIRRNIVSSGESTTRYARQAEDVAESKSDVETAGVQAKETAEGTYQQAADLARQQALDRVISAEEQQATQKASSSAQEDAFKKQQAATDLAWQREQQVRADALKAETDAIARARGAGSSCVMADAIPSADAALLAAQAKGGQAGVDAYNAAIASLQTQKQTAVQQAMQEAALRGSPAGAAQSQAGIVTGPYDQRIASLTQGLGSYQAGQAARTARMNDYESAVGAARSFIPQQVEMTVAPIRARGEFELRSQEMQGQQRLSEINANRDLSLARMSAAMVAAQVAAAKKAAEEEDKEKKLLVGELGGLMNMGAAEQLGNLRAGVGQQLSANEAGITQQVVARGGQAWQAGQTAIGRAERQAQGQLDLIPGIKALLDVYRNAQRDKFTPAATTSPGRQERMPGQAYDELGGWVGPSAPDPRQVRYPGQSYDELGGLVGPRAPTTGANTTADRNAAMSAIGRLVDAQLQQRENTALGGIRQRAGKIVPEAQRQVAGGLLRDTFSEMNRATAQRSSMLPSSTGQARQILLTPEQIEGLSPFERATLADAPGGIMGQRALEENVFGGPRFETQTDQFGQQRLVGGSGTAATGYPADVVRNAMIQVAEQLQAQGYDIGAPEVANALPLEGISGYNLLAGQAGGRTSEQEFAAAEAAEADLAKGDEAGIEAQEDADVAELASMGLGAPPSDLGTPSQALELMTGVETAPQFIAARDLAASIVDAWNPDEQGEMTRIKLTQELRRQGIPPQLITAALYALGIAG